MRNRFVLTIATALILIIAGCGGNPGSKPVVKVGDWTMDVDLFRRVLENRFGEAASEMSMAEMNESLDEVLNQRLVTLESYKLGYDTLAYSQEVYHRTLEDRILDALYSLEVINKIVTEPEIREFYKHDTEEIKAQHILVKVNESRSDADAERLASTIYHKAVNSDSTFTQLALRYNEDETTPDGHLGWFEWGIMVEPFQDAAFALKVDEVSQPVKTVFGWHVIKLLERKAKKNRPAFDAAKNDIRQRIMAGRVDELNAKSSDYLNSLLKKYDVELIDDNILEMLRLVDADLPGKMMSNPLAHFNDQQKSIVLATLSLEPKEFRVAHLEDFLLSAIRPTQRKIEKQSIKRMISQILAQEYLLPEEAKNSNLYEDPEIIKEAVDAREFYQFTYAKNARGESVGEPSDSAVYKYYEEHQPRYTTPTRYEGVEIMVDNMGKMRMIQNRMSMGESMESLARQYTIRANGKKLSGHIGPFPASVWGEAGKELESTKVGDVVGPLKLQGSYALFRVDKIYPSGLADFEDVRANAAAAVKTQMQKEDFAAWTDSLKDVYDYKLYPQNLKYVFSE